MIQKNIHIVGGGTAGWLTALLVKQFYPLYQITLIESDEIGILGAGEGTVPHIIDVLEFLNISITDLIKNADATLKLGIKFTNWNGDQTSYYHNFPSYPDIELYSRGEFYFLKHLLFSKLIAQASDLASFDLQTKLSKKSSVPFYIQGNSYADKSINQCGYYALHFDARKLALFLKELAISRGVKRVEGKVSKLQNNDKNQISMIFLEGGETLSTDFVFDCSGFSRLVVGKHYNTPWKSYKAHLPLDTAIPFFLPVDQNPKPLTEAIAMKYGWVWKIPTQSRYGCGYVFDSSYIDRNQAVEEIKNYFDIDIEVNKQFNFDAGSYEKTLVENSLAVGLSQSFVEPLEATSIWVSCLNLTDFLQSNGVNNDNPGFVQQFNDRCLRRNNSVLEFIHLHYLTQRQDTDFWKNFKVRCPSPEGLEDRIANMNFNFSESYTSSIFSDRSYLTIAHNLDLLDRNMFLQKINSMTISDQLTEIKEDLLNTQKNLLNVCISHQEFLDLYKS
jgi:tryptophan 7-halogenase